MNTNERKQALRHFHLLCRDLNLSSEDKRAIIYGAGYESSADVPLETLRTICEELGRQANPKAAEMDTLRKRVMAAIGGWLKAAGYRSNAEIIKAIACRASGYGAFNKIPAGRLHNLYHNFRNKQIDKIAADSLMRDIVAHRVDVAGLSGCPAPTPAARSTERVVYIPLSGDGKVN